ncbi:peptidase inhibitor family I36 protein [Streptomyces pratensis]|uniref:peptidase inhibitor family I36 protein n=1 Tax=Streptomyces pratensis TaxID=1169025 RepID=UPI0036415F25
MRKKMTVRLRPLTAAALTLGAAFAMTGLGGGAAVAADTDCPAQEFCLWADPGFTGRFAYSSEPQSNVGDYMNDRMTSYWNRTDNWISIYVDDKFQGCLYSIGPGDKISDMPSWANDETTSFRPGRFCRWTG